MPQKIIFQDAHFEWRDLVDPTEAELMQLAEDYKLPMSAVKDCLDAKHHPKLELFDNVNFLILRAYDEKASPRGDTVQELTRKIALFFGPAFLLTIHRKEQAFFTALRDKAGHEKSPKRPHGRIPFLADIVSEVISTYEEPMAYASERLEELEMGLFQVEGGRSFRIKMAYYLKRRAAVFRRVIRLTKEALIKMPTGLGSPRTSSFQRLSEKCDSLLYQGDQLSENVATLISLHLSLSSQKTNEASHHTGEIVRVLTIFSAFLLPLNLVTGIYGMNFRHMPELEWVYGYPMAIGIMITFEALIFLWFRKKGLIKL